MPTAAIYTRISKDDRDDGLGVDRQERLCRELAERTGLDVTMVLTDNDVSAYRARTRRPAFEDLVGAVRAGTVDAVVAYHADRLYRRTTDLERLVAVVEAHGAKVHTVAAGDVDLTTASGRMVARMLGAAAQHESERMGERLKAKMDELAAAGKPPGGRPPYGYASGYKIDPTEAAVVRLIADRILAGQSLLSIAHDLDAAGHRTREGRPWHHSTVRNAVKNPAVAGLRVHRREVAGAAEWDAILDRATWERVGAALSDPKRKTRRPVQKYPLTGLVESPAGDPMTGRPDRGTGGRADRRTYATRSPATQSMAVDADQLEDAVFEMVFIALDEAKLPAVKVDNTTIADVGTIEAELDELAAVRGAGTITMAEWLAARGPLVARLDAAKAAARVSTNPRVQLLGRPGAVRKAWPTLDAEARREIVSAVVERIVVGPATRARWTPIEDRLDPDQGFGIVWKA